MSGPPAPDLDQLAARLAVTDLVARYTWFGDRGRIAELVDLFTEDGVLDVGNHGGRWEGRDRIAAELDAVVERTREAARATAAIPGPVTHHVANHLVDVVPDRTAATCRATFLVLHGPGVDHWGTYRDRCRLDGDRWRFEERIVRVTGSSPNSRMVHSPVSG